MKRAAVFALALGLAAVRCGGGDEVIPEEAHAADPNRLARGAALYGELCAVCHGSTGQGGSGPVLRGFSRGEAELVHIIDERMPQGQPDRCNGSCPSDIAAFILSDFQRATPSCTEPSFGPRRLRLLTAREYRNTVATLFGWDDTSCLPTEFTYRPTGTPPRTVHIAGTMNGWPQTVALGGWPLVANAATGVFSLRRGLPTGTHQYKLVLDESTWLTDPQNPNRAPDGFGGYNSVLTITCQPKAPPAPPSDVTAGFPPDTRPDGFPFDDHVDARLVSAELADLYRRAGQSVAQAVAQDLPLFLASIVSCDGSTDKPACASEFVTRFGLRAFRRPLLPSEIERYKALILSQPTFAAGITLAISALLQSPHFLYRSELGEAQPDGSYRLSSYEVASALSYLYLGTMPDVDLFATAARDGLHDADAIEREVRRLLKSPASASALADFALSWLGVERVLTVDKRADLFAGFDALRRDFIDETRRFVGHVTFTGSGRLADLFTADYSFLSEALARHYGVVGVTGPTLRKVSYGVLPVARSGLLGHGSVLASYAHSDQTSPVRRGLFVRRSLLCQELPAPPPNAGGVPKVDAAATGRSRFAQHSNSAFCRSCHQYIDGVGFGFERFDAAGMARTLEAGQPIDASGDINDIDELGSHINAAYMSLPELGDQLGRADRVRDCFVRQYLRFSRGQKEDVAADLCTLDTLSRRFRDSDGRIVELMVATTQLHAFLYRR